MAWATTEDPRTEFITLRLTVSERAELDLYAQTQGRKRGVAARDAIFRVIRAERKREAKQKNRAK